MEADKEFETKILNIDPSEISNKLKSLGANETPEYMMRRIVFDMESKGIEWIRLREQNGKTTITYKYKELGNTLVGKTVEIEVEVSDFDKTAEILRKVPFKRTMYQENKVHIFHLNEIEFSIATWPKLSPYLEIEAKNEEGVQKGLKLLGLTGKDAGDLDIAELYKEIEIEMNSYPELKF